MTLAPGAERFCARIPRVWHVIEAEGLDAARRHGLLPTAALLDLAGRSADGVNRPDFVRLFLPGGPAVLRPQLMRDEHLAPTLHGAYAGQPALWRALIDRHVFFWASEARRDGFLRASVRERARSPAARSPEPPVLLEFEVRHLLAAHGAAVFSVINSGSTVRGGARTRRDEHTFRPVADYARGPVAELAIPGRVALDGAVVLPRA